MDIVYCEDCDNVHPATRQLDPWRWRCMAYPTEPGFGYVSKQYSPDPPYARCSDCNRYGDCPSFKPLRG